MRWVDEVAALQLLPCHGSSKDHSSHFHLELSEFPNLELRNLHMGRFSPNQHGLVRHVVPKDSVCDLM